MTTQYTTILKLALPVQGELSGTWGDVVNDNITSMVEEAVAGRKVINTWTANSHTLTSADGTTSESRAAILTLTDTGTALTGAGTVVCPALSKVYIVENSTAQVITIKTSGGTGIAVPVGRNMVVFCDGTNVEEGISNIASLSIGGDGATVTGIKDEDDMSSNSATKLATQQSIKAYVDSQVGANNELSEVLANGNTSGANDIIVDNGQKITVNTIDETTADSGVAIDSVLLKDDGVNATNLEVTNIKANDGTAAGSIADSTGVVTVASAVLTTADINGGTADGVVIGGTTPAAVTTSSLVATTADINAGTIDGTVIGGTTPAAVTTSSLVATTADINAGTIDGTVIGGSTAAAITGTTITGTSFVSSGDMTFGDNDKAIFGAGSDLEIYSTGANGFIENNTGLLILKNNSDDRDVAIQSDDGAGGVANYLLADGSTGALNAYHYGSEKLATTATGIDVTGNATFDDNGKAIFGAGSDLEIYHNGSNSIITETGTGNLYLGGDNLLLTNGSLSAAYLEAITGGAVNIYHNGSTKLATTSTGIDVTGTATMDGLTVDGIASVSATNPKIQLFETDTTDLNTQIQNQAGDFIVSRLDDDAGSLTVHFEIDHSTGNVSIPSGDLDVTGTVTATDLTLSDTNTPTLTITDTTNTTTLFLEAGNLSTTVGTSTDHPLKFDTNNIERIRITSDGLTGIGTGSPTELLTVAGNSQTATPTVLISDTDSSVAINQVVGKFAVSVSDGSSPGAGVKTSIQTIALNAVASHYGMTFHTTNNDGNDTERMRLDSSGNLLVGKSSTGFVDSNNWAVEGASVVQGHVSSLGSGSVYTYFIHGTSSIGTISQNGTTAVLYNTSSDERLKENIVDAPSASNDIDAIQVRSFDWKADGSHQKYGMVAQELQGVAPEAVSAPEDSEEMMGVDYSKLVPMLVKEIQSLRSRVHQLENN